MNDNFFILAPYNLFDNTIIRACLGFRTIILRQVQAGSLFPITKIKPFFK